MIPGTQKKGKDEGGYARGKSRCDQYKGQDDGGYARGRSRCDQFSAVIAWNMMGDMRGVGQCVISLVL